MSSTSANRNVGSDQPMIARMRVVWSIHVSRWMPARVPSQMPNNMTMGAANRFISKVMGK